MNFPVVVQGQKWLRPRICGKKSSRTLKQTFDQRKLKQTKAITYDEQTKMKRSAGQKAVPEKKTAFLSDISLHFWLFVVHQVCHGRKNQILLPYDQTYVDNKCASSFQWKNLAIKYRHNSNSIQLCVCLLHLFLFYIVFISFPNSQIPRQTPNSIMSRKSFSTCVCLGTSIYFV